MLQGQGGWHKSTKLSMFLMKSGGSLASTTVILALVVFYWAAVVGTELMIRHYGEETKAVVTERLERKVSCGRSWKNKKCTNYYLDFDYFADGQLFAEHQRVDKKLFGAVLLGEKLSVIYLKSAPDWSVLERSQHNLEKIPPLKFGGLVLLFLAYLSYRRLKRVTEIIFLRDHGIRRRAKVVSVNDLLLRFAGDHFHSICWIDRQGLTGESLWQTSDHLPKVGTGIIVFVDPKGVIAPVWYQDCGGPQSRRKPKPRLAEATTS